MTPYYNFSISLLIVAGIMTGLLLLRKALFSLSRHLAKKTESEIDDLLIEGLEKPSLLLVIALALYISIRLSGLPDTYTPYAIKGMYLSLVLTMTMGIANISGKLLAYFLKKAELPISVSSLLNAVTRTLVYAIGILIMLNYLGVSIAPIVTAMGVGGLAMALALQDTLSNLFAGIHILAEHTIRVGDFIKLETGQEGFVEDISWRTTRVRMVSNNMVIVPNSKLSQSVAMNYYLPERRMVINLPVSVSFDSDIDIVEKALLEEANKSAQEVPGLLSDPAPQVFLVPGFGPSSLDFTLACSIKDVTDQKPVMNELNKRIFKRLKHEGIEIPYPTHIVQMKNIMTR